MVEHQSGNREIVIEATSAKQVVYIYGCSDSVVQVRRQLYDCMNECWLFPGLHVLVAGCD